MVPPSPSPPGDPSASPPHPLTSADIATAAFAAARAARYTPNAAEAAATRPPSSPLPALLAAVGVPLGAAFALRRQLRPPFAVRVVVNVGALAVAAAGAAEVARGAASGAAERLAGLDEASPLANEVRAVAMAAEGGTLGGTWVATHVPPSVLAAMADRAAAAEASGEGRGAAGVYPLSGGPPRLAGAGGASPVGEERPKLLVSRPPRPPEAAAPGGRDVWAVSAAAEAAAARATAAVRENRRRRRHGGVDGAEELTEIGRAHV